MDSTSFTSLKTRRKKKHKNNVSSGFQVHPLQHPHPWDRATSPVHVESYALNPDHHGCPSRRRSPNALGGWQQNAAKVHWFTL